MSFEITRLLVDDNGYWAIEVENISGFNLDPAEFSFGFSVANNGGILERSLDSFDAAPNPISPGALLVIGSNRLPETTLADDMFAPYWPIQFYDMFFIADADGNYIDTIGEIDGDAPPAEDPGEYTANADRSADSDVTDTFVLTDDFNCLAAGTSVATSVGSVNVEDIEIGTLVITHDGRNVPVTWVGRQQVNARSMHSHSLRVVRIAKDALGVGAPRRDLTLTADHALLLDGMLVNAGALVNGTTITEVPRSELTPGFTVYNIETEAHEAILAEGVAVETLVDYTGRSAFDNYDDYMALYGAERVIAEMQLPRISSRRLLPHGIGTDLRSDGNCCHTRAA